MKMFKLNLRDSIVYLLIVFGLALLTASCSNVKSQEPRTFDPVQIVADWRAICLENGSIVRVSMNRLDFSLYIPNDTAWVNLQTHRIDDSSEQAMLCVLKSYKIRPHVLHDTTLRGR